MIREWGEALPRWVPGPHGEPGVGSILYLAGGDTVGEELSNAKIGWLVGAQPGQALDPEFVHGLDNPRRGLITTLIPLGLALQAIHNLKPLRHTVGKVMGCDRLASPSTPWCVWRAPLGATVRRHIIRAFAARYSKLEELDTRIRCSGPTLRSYAAAHAAAAIPASGEHFGLARPFRPAQRE